MQNLDSLPVTRISGRRTPSATVTSIGVMTVMQCEQNLHKITPNGIFRYQSVMFRSLFDGDGQISTSAVFHEDVENASIVVNYSVDVLHNVLMTKVFEVGANEECGRCAEKEKELVRKGSNKEEMTLTLPQQYVSYTLRSSS